MEGRDRGGNLGENEGGERQGNGTFETMGRSKNAGKMHNICMILHNSKSNNQRRGGNKEGYRK